MGLDGVELILATEEEFGIEIADSDAANLLTPRQLAAHVSHLLGLGNLKSQTTSDPEHVLQRIMQLTAVQLGLKIGQFNPDSRFVEDLGLD